jgi:hypothetical protein
LQNKRYAVFTITIEQFVIQVCPVEDVKGILFFNNQFVHLGSICYFGGGDYGGIGNLNDGISILGQGLQIMRRDINGRSGLTNTIHPLFLTPNLSQVVVLLQGLQHMATDKIYSEYALMLSANIWSELSYARSRIINISSQLGLDVEWFAALETKRCTNQDKGRNKSIYATEVECSNDEGPGNVLDFLKNRKPCTIEVQDEGGCKILGNCLVTELAEGGKVKILHNGVRLVYPVEAIRASRYGKCIY